MFICSVALVVALSIDIRISSWGRNKQPTREEDGGSGAFVSAFDFVLFCTFLRGFDHGCSKAWQYQRGVGIFSFGCFFFCSSSIFFPRQIV